MTYRLEANALDRLFKALGTKGYVIFGPTVRDSAVVYDRIESPNDLPAGWADQQTNGSYRLVKTDSPAYFDFTAPPQSWKRLLFPPSLHLFRSHRRNGTLEILEEEHETEPMAFLGVRPCDLRALAILDSVYLNGGASDSTYRQRREKTLIIAVNCTRAGGTCFCASMGTGPEAGAGFDLCLTELVSEHDHYFLVESGSAKGESCVSPLQAREATPQEQTSGREAIRTAAAAMGRSLQTQGLPELLAANLSHPRWDQIARRCLACANCTMVCPTCFCSTVEDSTDLSGAIASRTRLWDSCFTAEFSYIHGGSLRPTIKSRYRQWMTHKLSSWVAQFGSFGCVGCGRCITWCPVGIDLTEEARILRGQAAEHV
ncbi:MAG: 4Fe-4S dicluster domain-containing protein [Ignavibacteriales bacterium]|nr:4Fe-4S dicluster domain-containing protein [Ignavibacteriales bacterium]